MRIWLATVGEPLPMDDENVRLHRNGQLAQWLADQGHDVVFFTGTMDHYGRRLRTKGSTIYEMASNYRIVTLQGRLYHQTISYKRFMNHRDVAAAFRRFAGQFEQPDIILASYLIEELCRAVLDYAQPRNIPVVIDARDLWPDIFAELLPRPLRSLAPLAFYPLERAARRTFARASSLCGMSPSSAQWAQQKAGREPHEQDFWFPFSYPNIERLPPVEHEGIRLCFLGSLSHRSNLELLIDTVIKLRERDIPVHLDLCGKGHGESALRQRAGSCPAISFHGWVGTGRLKQVMAASDLGVLPYDRPDFHTSLPNKFVEYLAGGLAVLSCTDGEVRRLIHERGCGVWAQPNIEAMASAIAALKQPEISVLRNNSVALFDEVFQQDAAFGKALHNLQSIVRAHEGRPTLA